MLSVKDRISIPTIAEVRSWIRKIMDKNQGQKVENTRPNNRPRIKPKTTCGSGHSQSLFCDPSGLEGSVLLLCRSPLCLPLPSGNGFVIAGEAFFEFFVNKPVSVRKHGRV